jgi:hypothetical protein
MEIEVELIGEEIVVTKPGTTFLLAYRKSVEEPRLVLRRSWIPPTTDSIRSTFRAGRSQQGARAGVGCVARSPARWTQPGFLPAD